MNSRHSTSDNRVFRSEADGKPMQQHYRHLNGFSPVCTRICSLSLFFQRKLLSHMEHWNGLCVVCVSMWFCNKTWFLNNKNSCSRVYNVEQINEVNKLWPIDQDREPHCVRVPDDTKRGSYDFLWAHFDITLTLYGYAIQLLVACERVRQWRLLTFRANSRVNDLPQTLQTHGRLLGSTW